MAPTTTPIPPPVIPPHPKPKRPIPAGIQTNGAASSSSPSPSMSAKKPPNSAKQSGKGAASNGGNVTVARPNIYIRSEITALANGNARSSISAASAAPPGPSSAVEPTAVPVVPEQQPNTKYILAKFVGSPPSLVVHMYHTHFKFDSQDDYFPYTSPMRFFIDHLRARTIPHDLVAEFNEADVPYYEGCLIVEVHNHRIAAVEEKEDVRPSSRSKDEVANSIHKYNRFVTPSPSRPFPKDAATATNGHSKKSDVSQQGHRAGSNEQGNSSASGSPQSQKKKAPSVVISTVVLFPTQQSRQADLALKACNLKGSVDGAPNGVPPTPSAAVPPTPTGSSMPPPAKKVKREPMELDSSNIYEAEGKMLLGSLPPLDLEPTKDARGTIAILEEQAEAVIYRFHPAPMPKTRKRTVAEMAADEAHAAGKERYLLLLDERNGQGGISMSGGEGQQQAQPFDPTFERFKKIEDIKRDHLERAAQEKIKQAENERTLQERKQKELLQQQQQAQAQAQQQQQQQQAALEERNRQEQDAHRAQIASQQQEVIRRRNLAYQQAQRQNALAASQNPHAHPMANTPVNGIPVSLPVSAPNGMSMVNGRMQGTVTQPTASSPMVRHNTPQMSSPMPGSVAMQASGSSAGAGSPARPPSVVNQQPMTVPMAVSMSARGSQQSHPSGTPRMSHVTPNMAHATPISRAQQMANTPRMTQASPPPNMTAPQMQQMMMNNPAMAHLGGNSQHNTQQYAQLLAHQQRSMQHAQLVNGGMNMTPQQQQMRQQQIMLQQQQQQAQQQQRAQMLRQNPGLANNPQVMAHMVRTQQIQYAQQQQQQQQQHQAAQAAQQGIRQGMVNGGAVHFPNPQAAMQQQIAQQQQIYQQQMAAQAQQMMQQAGQQPNQANQKMISQQMLQSIYQRVYVQNLPNWLAQNGFASDAAAPRPNLDAFKAQCQNQARAFAARQFATARQQNGQQMSPQQAQQAQQQAQAQQQQLFLQQQQQRMMQQQQAQQQQQNLQMMSQQGGM